MAVAIGLVHDDSQTPNVVLQRKSILLHHVRTKVGWASPQLTLSTLLSEMLVSAFKDAIEVSYFWETLRSYDSYMVDQNILKLKITVSYIELMHIMNSLGNTTNNTVPLFIILNLLPVLRKVAIGTQFHQQIDVCLVVEACVELCQIRVIEEAMGLNPQYQLLNILYLFLPNDLQSIIKICTYVLHQKYSSDTALPQHLANDKLSDFSIGCFGFNFPQLRFCFSEMKFL